MKVPLQFASRTLLLILGCWSTSPAAGRDVLVATSGAAARRSPNRLAEMIRPLKEGEVLEVSEADRGQDYLRVRLPETGDEAWVHRSYMRPVLRPAGARGARTAEHPAAAHISAEEDAFSQLHLGPGRPLGVHERHRQGYSVGVDARLRIPLWVQYRLRAGELSGAGDRDLSSFRADASLPGLVRAGLGDYSGSGFDRGHMAPAGDMKRSQHVMDESFLLSNISPQVGVGFNRDIWELLEGAVRDWVRNRDELTVITGPIFTADNDDTVTYAVIGENQVAVPNAFFKIVHDGARREALAFLMPNRALFGREIGEFLVSIDEIESRTGLDFLGELPDDEEEPLERRVATGLWSTGAEHRELVARAAEAVRMVVIEFDESGRIVGEPQLDSLVAQIRAAQPTHLFLLAHGWNNSRSEAEESYQAILSLMGQAADEHPGLRPAEYRPFVVGVHWPSKRWDEGSGRLRSMGSDDDLTLAIATVLPAERAERRPDGTSLYLQDVLAMRHLLTKPPADVTEADVADAWRILQRYSTTPSASEDRSAFDSAGAQGRADLEGVAPAGVSVRDVFRIFTFWQMKKRAGTVGQAGGRPLVQRLMEDFKRARHECLCEISNGRTCSDFIVHS